MSASSPPHLSVVLQSQVLPYSDRASGSELHLLRAVAQGASHLTGASDLHTGVTRALECLGVAAGVDHCYVFRHSDAERATSPYAMWAREGRASPWLDEIAAGGPWADDEFSEVIEPLKAGHAVGGPTRYKSGANYELNARAGVLSDLMVPIFAGGEFWGLLGLDDVRTERRWTASEIEVLRGAAGAIAVAVEREAVSVQRLDDLYRVNRELARREALLQVAIEASAALLRAPDFFDCIDEVLELLGRALGMDRVCLATFETDPAADRDAYYEIRREWDAPGVARQMDDPHLRRLSASSMPELLDQLLAGLPVQASIEQMSARAQEEQRACGVRLGIALPIFLHGRLWGVLGFDDCHSAAERDATELNFLRIVANALGAAVRGRQLAQAMARTREEAARRRNAELAQINAVLRTSIARLASVDEIRGFIEEAAVAAAHITGAISTSFSVVDDSGTLRFESVHHLGRAIDLRHDPALGSLLSREIRAPFALDREGFEQFAGDTGIWWARIDDERAIPELRQWSISIGVRFYAIVPLFRGDEITGFLTLRYGDQPRPPGHQIDLLHTIAHQMALALELRRLSQLTREAAVEKARTQAAQDRAFELAQANAALRRTVQRLANARDIKAFAETFVLEAVQATGAKSAILAERLVHSAFTARACAYMGSLVDLQDVVISRVVFELGEEGDALGYLRRTAAGEIVHYTIDELESWNPRAAASARAGGLRSFWHFPFQRDADVLGFLALAFDAERAPTSVQHETMQAFANQAALVIETLRLASRVREAAVHSEREEVVRQLSRANAAMRGGIERLASKPELHAFLEHIVLESVRQSGASNARLLLRDHEGGEWRTATTVEGSEVIRPQNPDAPTRISCEPAAVFGGDLVEPLHITVSTEPGRFTSEFHSHHASRGCRALLSVPMRLADRLIGVLELGFAHERLIAGHESELLVALAQQATTAIQLTQLAGRAREVAVLAERNRIGQEIHDGLAQSFTGILMQLGAVEESAGVYADPAISRALHLIRTLARDGLRDARRSVMALRPEAAMRGGLDAALRRLAQSSSIAGKIDCVYHTSSQGTDLTPLVEHELYRIAQEAVSNAVRHASPTRIEIGLTRAADCWSLAIVDNGVGMPTALDVYAQQGFGIESMRDRARSIGASFEIETGLGQGACIRISIPVRASQ